ANMATCPMMTDNRIAMTYFLMLIGGLPPIPGRPAGARPRGPRRLDPAGKPTGAASGRRDRRPYCRISELRNRDRTLAACPLDWEAFQLPREPPRRPPLLESPDASGRA